MQWLIIIGMGSFRRADRQTLAQYSIYILYIYMLLHGMIRLITIFAFKRALLVAVIPVYIGANCLH
jgi:hypothetical protein